MTTPPFKVEAELSGVSTRRDGSLGIRFTTKELGIEDKLSIMEYNGKYGWLLFSPSAIDDADIPKEEKIEKGTKTDSQRLRAVLYILWKEKSKEPDFQNYYRKQMNIIIETIKKQLPEL